MKRNSKHKATEIEDGFIDGLHSYSGKSQGTTGKLASHHIVPATINE